MSTNGPDPRKPWCPVCEEHTDYHLESEDRATYTCNECSSSTWKPTAPGPLTIVVLGLVFSLNALAFAALLLIIPGFLTDIVGFLLIIPVTRKFLIRPISSKFKKKEENSDVIEGVAEEENDKKNKNEL